MANDNADGIDLYADVDDFGVEQDFHEGDIYDGMIANRGNMPFDEKYSNHPMRQNAFNKNHALYVSNLTWWTSDKDLLDAIISVGVTDILEIKFHENRVNGQSKGFATVVVDSEVSHKVVMEKLGKMEMHGQKIFVCNCTPAALKQLDSSTRKESLPQSNGQPSQLMLPSHMISNQPLTRLKNPLPPPPPSGMISRPLQPSPSSQILGQPQQNQFVIQGGVLSPLQQPPTRILLPGQPPNMALPPPTLYQPPPQLSINQPTSVMVRAPFQGRLPHAGPGGDFAGPQQLPQQLQPFPQQPGLPPQQQQQLPPQQQIPSQHRMVPPHHHSNILRPTQVIRLPAGVEVRDGYQQPPPGLSQVRQPTMVVQTLGGIVTGPFNPQLPQQPPQQQQHLPHPQQQHPPSQQQFLHQQHQNQQLQQQQNIQQQQQSQQHRQQLAVQHPTQPNGQTSFLPQQPLQHRPQNAQPIPVDQFGRPLPGYPSENFPHQGHRIVASHSMPVQGLPVSSNSSSNTSLGITDPYMKEHRESSEGYRHEKELRHTSPSLPPTELVSDVEFDEILHRNKSVSSSAISRAVQDASAGEYASAIETLVTAISLIKQSKIASDDRCRILISSLQDTLHGIESKSYGSKSSSFSRSERRARSPRERSEAHGVRVRERSRSREHKRSRVSRDKERHYKKNPEEYYKEYKEYEESRRH